MLNKLKFNNLVISNKKGIQQARTQTINKLVHKIRKLKTLLEKRPEDDKCKERIRKSTESLELLKKFKRMEIMKQVLLMEKPPAAIITNGLSSPQEIAVALLAMNKVMQVLIKRFKTELELTEDSSAQWREDLKENSKRRQKIERTETKKIKRKTMKEQKAMDNKRKEWLEQNLEKDESVKVVADVSTVGGWIVEEVEGGNKTEIEECKEIDIKPNELPKKIQKDIPQPNKIKRPQQEKKLEKSLSKKPKIEKEQKQKILKVEDSQSSVEEEEIKEEISPDSDNETESHVVDPFFVTETGENYLSTAVIKRGNNAQDQDGDKNQKHLHMIKLNGSKKQTNFRERHQGNRNEKRTQNGTLYKNKPEGTWKQNGNSYQNYDNDKKSWQRNNFNDGHNKNNNRDKQSGDNGRKRPERSSNSSNVKMDAKPEEKLHPSWAAKQKQKPIITGFQGKKITFDDDGSTNNSDLKNNVNTYKKDKNISSSLSTAESLHPSWAAKQKQKPTITAFQGKKITFDVEE